VCLPPRAVDGFCDPFGGWGLERPFFPVRLPGREVVDFRTTTAVADESALTLVEFDVTVTSTRSRLPRSALFTRYVRVEAPAIAEHEVIFAPQRFHRYV
jgi:hypothetical protein